MDIKIEPEFVEVITTYQYKHEVDDNMTVNVATELSDYDNATATNTTIIKQEVTEVSDNALINIKQEAFDIKEETLNVNETLSTTSLNVTDSKRKEACDVNSKVSNETKPIKCATCFAAFSTKSGLFYHKRKHSGEKPFHCPFCDYKCTKKYSLKIHNRVHTGEKPFHCTICDYKTGMKSCLIYHTRSHTGEKPFSCNICDYKAIQKCHLKRHMNVHKKVKPVLNCTLCDNNCIEKLLVKPEEDKRVLKTYSKMQSKKIG